MLKKPIKELKGKNIAIVAMGESQLDYHLAITHSEKFDETWVINAMVGVIPKPDRAFVMDPVSRFFDTNDAGDMTKMMREVLPKTKCPIYTSELVKDSHCGYINNTVAYAIAFAYWNKVGRVQIFGADFIYKKNLYFAEMGRGCCEFWLAKCMEKNIEVSIATRSNLLDANVDIKDKLYGYHRLNDPMVSYINGNGMNVCKWSEVVKQHAIPYGISGREDPLPPEPEKF